MNWAPLTKCSPMMREIGRPVPVKVSRQRKQPPQVDHVPTVVKSPPESMWISADRGVAVTSVPSAPPGQGQDMSKVHEVIRAIFAQVTAAWEWKDSLYIDEVLSPEFGCSASLLVGARQPKDQRVPNGSNEDIEVLLVRMEGWRWSRAYSNTCSRTRNAWEQQVMGTWTRKVGAKPEVWAI